MSAFAIFVIVLTLGYVLYYAAMITIDLNAKSKSETSTEETISTDGISEDAEEYAPRNVIENAETGGFSFRDSQASHADERPSENVTEEEEQPSEIEEAPAEEDTTEQEPVDDNPAEIVQESNGEKASADEQPEESEDSEEVTDDEPSDAETGDVSDEVSSENEEQAIQESTDIPSGETDEQSLEPKHSEPFDINKAFDEEALQPKYGVSEIIEPAPSDEVLQRLEVVNSSLASIKVKGNVMDTYQLTKVIHEKNSAKYNLDTQDEITKC